MNNETILKRAIEKAVKNGYDPEFFATVPINKYIKQIAEYSQLGTIIFSHDFAKAFWGKKRIRFWCGQEWCGNNGEHYHEREVNWRNELQQMVLEKEPLKYLAKFL